MITKNSLARAVVMTAILSAIAVSTTHAALVTFGPATTIVGDSDVDTTLGVVVGAFNVGDGGVSSTTVNGVTFQPFALNSTGGPVSSGTVGDFTLFTTDLFVSDNTLYGSAVGPFSSLSSNYQTLLESATITVFETFTLTMNNLVVGQTYDFQWWANLSGPVDPDFPFDQLHFAEAGPNAANTVILNDNFLNIEGGVGQYSVGRFTADSTSQVINFTPDPLGAYAQINAFQLRTVPEPSTVLFGLALAGVCFGGRRRARSSYSKS